MPRVKRGTKRNDRRKKILKRASGYFLTKSKLYQAAQEAVERGLKFAYTGRRQAEQLQLFAADQRPQKGRHRAGPQDPLGHRHSGRARVYSPRRAGQGCA